MKAIRCEKIIEEKAEMPEADMSSGEYYRHRRLNSDVSQQPLPDLVQNSAEYTQRSRSSSISLPPEHALFIDIGRRLRTISDGFRLDHEAARQQRQQRDEPNNNSPPDDEDSVYSVLKAFKKH